MLIYHSHCMDSNGFQIRGKNVKNMKNVRKGYKSRVNRKSAVIRSKVLRTSSQKKTKVKRRKNLSKQNKQFLEGLGLKVKEHKENC